MTAEESIFTGIRARQYMRVEYIDHAGLPRTDILEGYTLGLDRSTQKILKGFHWASDPGPAYSKGPRAYPIEQITSVELMGQKFGRPYDEAGAKDFSGFTHIIYNWYFPA